MSKSASYTKRGPGRSAKQGKRSKAGKAARLIAKSGGG